MINIFYMTITLTQPCPFSTLSLAHLLGVSMGEFDSFMGGRGEWTPASTAMMRSALAKSSIVSAVRGSYAPQDLEDTRPFAVRKLPTRSALGR